MKNLTVTLRGIRPLIMHNGLLADPTNPYTLAIKRITAKGSKKMTEADYQERDYLEWCGGLYRDDQLGLVIPGVNIERTIQLGAQKSRLGKDVAAAVFVSEANVPLKFRTRTGHTGQSAPEKLYADSEMTMRAGVKVQQARIIRVRPMIPTGWELRFGLEFDESILNRGNLVRALTDAGALIGLGDWRPRFGRFLVEVGAE